MGRQRRGSLPCSKNTTRAPSLGRKNPSNPGAFLRQPRACSAFRTGTWGAAFLLESSNQGSQAAVNTYFVRDGENISAEGVVCAIGGVDVTYREVRTMPETSRRLYSLSRVKCKGTCSPWHPAPTHILGNIKGLGRTTDLTENRSVFGGFSPDWSLLAPLVHMSKDQSKLMASFTTHLEIPRQSLLPRTLRTFSSA